MNEAKLSLQQWRTVEATSGGTRRAKQRWSKGTTTQGCQMTYSNDSNKKNNMRDEGSYTGWIVGGLLALAVIVAIFAFGRNGSQTDTADNNRANSSATTSRPSPGAPPATTGSAGTTSTSPPATNR
jgi:hypothetical protein